MVEPANATYGYHGHRSISAKTFEFYNVLTQFVDDQPIKVAFVYPNKAIQWRLLSHKEFYFEGPASDAACFGVDKFDAGGKSSVTIFEGAYDALAGYEILRGDSACISVRSSSSAKRDITRDYEFINSFDRIVLAFDGDEPGQSAARAVASVFDFAKVYHVKLTRHKDSNAYLEADEAEEFYKAWKAAKRYAPDNIISTFGEFARSLTKTKEDLLATYPFGDLQSRLYGLFAGEVIVFKGLEGIGKTEIFRALEYHILNTTAINIGILHFEEDNGTTLKALAGYQLKAPTVLPDSPYSNDDILSAIKTLVKGAEDRIHIHSSWDIEDENTILDNIRFLASAANCRILFLDHITWLATGQNDDDERKKLDRISQKLKLLAKELNICICVISHVNDAGQTRGSRNITKNANTVIHLNRDVTNSDQNERLSTHLIIEKARLGGNTGPAGTVVFDRETYTLREKSYEDSVKTPNLS